MCFMRFPLLTVARDIGIAILHNRGINESRFWTHNTISKTRSARSCKTWHVVHSWIQGLRLLQPLPCHSLLDLYWPVNMTSRNFRTTVSHRQHSRCQMLYMHWPNNAGYSNWNICFTYTRVWLQISANHLQTNETTTNTTAPMMAWSEWRWLPRHV
jgi:hypothetical protein